MNKKKWLALMCIVVSVGLTACKSDRSDENAEAGEKAVLYTKNGELYAASDEKMTVCLDSGADAYYEAEFSEDGQSVFWLIPEADGSGELKMQQMAEDTSPVVIDDRVKVFEICDNDEVVYMTADEKIYLNGESGAGEILTEKGTLYQADKSAKTIIWAEGSDGDTSLFMKNTDSEDPIKQVDGIQSLLYSSSDYMTLVAQKQNGIYFTENFSEPEKLPEGIVNVLGSCCGSIVYNRQDGDEVNSYLYTDGQEYKLDKTINTGIFMTDEAEKKAYVLILENERSVPSMYSIDFKEKGAMIHRDDDVSEIYSAKDGACYYAKSTDIGSSKVDLYCNEKLVESDIEVGMAWQTEGSEAIWFAKDLDMETGSFTLKYCEDGQVTEAAKDVSSAKLCADGSAFVLTDYDQTAQKGVLSLYERGKLAHIDEYVKEIHLPDIAA